MLLNNSDALFFSFMEMSHYPESQTNNGIRSQMPNGDQCSCYELPKSLTTSWSNAAEMATSCIISMQLLDLCFLFFFFIYRWMIEWSSYKLLWILKLIEKSETIATNL